MRQTIKWIMSLVLIAVCISPAAATAQIQYVPKKTDETTEASHEIKKDKESEIDAKTDESLPAEHIVVSVSEDGYVTSHGDHYHYYNGQVPYESIFSESVLAPKDYQLNEKDIVSEVKDGVIVKIDKKYALYIKDLAKATTVRTADELMLQSHDVYPKDAKAIVNLRTTLSLADGTPIMYEAEKSYDEFVKALAKPASVVWITANEFVLLTDDGLVVFPGKVSADMDFDEHLVAKEEFNYQDKDVLYKVDGLTVVQKDDHVYIVK
ncbi:pneumococcal-type histidine triad protein [Aerococcaceae bacterium zg-BR22]|uniref:pneumococcal-type histidine triad protein n=1 Tax=Aerococcaceae bacterium zg-1292 TaxID=2774330 RepID=UPI004062E3E8|nr:pneumococcal-type histidine triad protein [Aerococcaceae bacterium zg-BR22]